MQGAEGRRVFGAPSQLSWDILVCCVAALAFCVTVAFLHWLQGVFVPFIFALALALVCEPLLRKLVQAPECLWQRPLEKPLDLDLGEAASEEQFQRPCVRSPSCGQVLSKILRQIWDVIAVVLCAVLPVAMLIGLILALVRVCAMVDWATYQKSPKLVQLQHYLQKLGVLNQDQSLDLAQVWQHWKSTIMSVAGSLLGVAENLLLVFIMLLFTLFAMLPGIHSDRPRSKALEVVQKYLMCKSVAGFILAVAVAIALKCMKVPLVLVSAVITFCLNYIPNLGSLIAMLTPVPLFWLEADTGVVDSVMVVVVQFVIHTILGNFVEPQIMSLQLDLHPLIVVLSLTFWSSIWGISGAVMSVPIVCALRLSLQEVQHPYAQAASRAFAHPLDWSLPSPPSAALAPARGSGGGSIAGRALLECEGA